MSESDGWFKSSFSGNGSCVEVQLREGIQVRDSKNPFGPVLEFTENEWIAFLAGVRNGEFDIPGHLEPAAETA